MDRSNRRQPITSNRGRDRPDPDRDPATVLDLGKSVLVGCVVSDKNRLASEERRLAEKSADCRALVGAARLELDDHFAGDQPQRATCLTFQSFGKHVDFRGTFRRRAVMKRQRASFVLQNKMGPHARECDKPGPDLVESRRSLAVSAAVERTVGAPTLAAVDPGGWPAPRSEKAIKLGQWAAADQRQGTAPLLGQITEQSGQSGRHLNAIRAGGNFEQGAVDIEE